MKRESDVHILKDSRKSSIRVLDGLGWMFQQRNEPEHAASVVMEQLHQGKHCWFSFYQRPEINFFLLS